MKMKVMLTICLLFSPLSYAQTVNKCIGQDGKPVYQQLPCSDGQGNQLKINAEPKEEGGLRAGERSLLKKAAPRLDKAIDDAEWSRAEMEGRVKNTRTRTHTETTTERTNP